MPHRIDYSDHSFAIDGLFDSNTCLSFIETCEEEGFDDAPITTRDGPVMMQHVRNNLRVMVDDAEWAEDLFKTIVPWLPDQWLTISDCGQRYEVCGLNERLRFYRYDPGQRFKIHRDGHFQREDGSERSYLTVLIYLNEQFMGGHTRLFQSEVVDVEPKTGLVLCFNHNLMHEGAEVEVGRKYVLRTDVMYRRV